MSVGPQVVLTDRVRDHAKWLQARRTGLGGSDAAAAVGLSRWRSPLAIWLAKMGWDVPREDTEAMGWGHALEEPIRCAVERRLGITLHASKGLYRDGVHRYLLASPDAVAVKEQLLGEWKVIGPRQLASWEEGPPIEVELQARHYLAVLGMDRAVVAALLGGVRLETWEIERDPEIEGELLDREAAFWRLVEAKTPPVAVGSEQETAALRDAFSEAGGEGAELDAEARGWLRRRALAIVEGKEAEERKRLAENELRAWLGMRGTRCGLVDRAPAVEIRTHTRETVDVDALRRAAPELVAGYVRPTSYDRWWTPKEGA